MECKRICENLRDLNSLFSDNDVVFFNSLFGEYRYDALKEGNFRSMENNIINNQGSTQTYNYVDNMNSDKKKPCEYCGEYGSWRKDWSDVKHSKKNCPYKYLWGIECNKKFSTLIQLMGKYERKQMELYKLEVNECHNKEKEMDKIKATLEAECEVKCEVERKKAEETAAELKLFHRIMPQDTIKQRLEEHNMMLEEQNSRKLAADETVNAAKEKLEEMEKQEQILELNQEMRNIKLKNLEHKCSQLKEEKDLVKSLAQEKQVEHNEEMKEMEKKLDKAKKVMDKINVIYKAECDCHQETQSLNDKLLGLLKKGKIINDECCSICQMDIVDEEMTLNCGHKFHSSCLCKYWIGECRTNRHKCTYKCPNCRGEAVVVNNYSGY